MLHRRGGTRTDGSRRRHVRETLGKTLLGLPVPSDAPYLPTREVLGRAFRRSAHSVQFAASSTFEPAPLCKHYVASSLDPTGLGPRSLFAGQFGVLTFSSELAGAVADLHARVLVGEKTEDECNSLLIEMHGIMDDMFTAYNDERLLREERAETAGAASPPMQTRQRRQRASLLAEGPDAEDVGGATIPQPLEGISRQS